MTFISVIILIVSLIFYDIIATSLTANSTKIFFKKKVPKPAAAAVATPDEALQVSDSEGIEVDTQVIGNKATNPNKHMLFRCAL